MGECRHFDEMNHYVPLLMLFIGAVMIGGLLMGLSHLFSPKKITPEKMMTYECGFDPVGGSRNRFSVKFYLVAMLFILFDIEVVFLYPWAVLFREYIANGAGLFVLIEMVVFLGILFVGLAYVYGKKAVDWK